MILEAARKVLQIEADAVLSFPRGLIGLGGSRYALLSTDPDSPFSWLHSIEDPDGVDRAARQAAVGERRARRLRQRACALAEPEPERVPAHRHRGAFTFERREGESVELAARERKVRAIAMTGQPASSVGRAADRVISVAISQEACPLNLAPTASTTAMLAMGDALAMAISEKRGFREEDFAALHPGGRLGRKFLKVKDLMRTGDRIPLVTRETPMTEAIHEMSRKMMGITAVVNGRGELAGVISDGDLRRLLENDRSLLARTAGECSHARPKTISAEDLASEALQRMQQAKITSLFVVDDAGSLAGAIHMHDLLAAGIA